MQNPQSNLGSEPSEPINSANETKDQDLILPTSASTSQSSQAKKELHEAMDASRYAADRWQRALCTGSKEVCDSTSTLISDKPWHATCLAMTAAFLTGWCLGKHINR